jgi:hypothetical protein
LGQFFYPLLFQEYILCINPNHYKIKSKSDKKDYVTLFIQVWCLRTTSAICFSFYCHLYFTPSTQCSSVIFILYKGYSLSQIQFKTGLEKSTIDRIMKEMDINKIKSKGSHSSKLSYCDKQYFIY